MAITPINSTKAVTTAGTRVALTANTAIKPASIYIEAKAANTGYIYVGVDTVSSTQYITRLAAGEGLELASPDPSNRMGIQVSSIYIDSSVNAEGVNFSYLYPTGG